MFKICRSLSRCANSVIYSGRRSPGWRKWHMENISTPISAPATTLFLSSKSTLKLNGILVWTFFYELGRLTWICLSITAGQWINYLYRLFSTANPPIHPLIAPHRDIHLRRRFLNYRFLIVKSPLKHPSDWGNHLKYERTFSFWIWRIQLFQKFSYLKLSTFQVFVFKLFTFRALHPVLLLHYLALYSHLTTTTNRQNGPPSETFYMQNISQCFFSW